MNMDKLSERKVLNQRQEYHEICPKDPESWFLLLQWALNFQTSKNSGYDTRPEEKILQSIDSHLDLFLRVILQFKINIINTFTILYTLSCHDIILWEITILVDVKSSHTLLSLLHLLSMLFQWTDLLCNGFKLFLYRPKSEHSLPMSVNY